MQFAVLFAFKPFENVCREAEAIYDALTEQGYDVHPAFGWSAVTNIVNFTGTVAFTRSGITVWHEVNEALSEDEKLSLLTDEEWRARARKSWDNQDARSQFRHPETILLRHSDTGFGPVGCSLASYMVEAGIEHPSDALAEWVVLNGVNSYLQRPYVEIDDDEVVRFIRDPRTIGSLSDSGAHGKTFCGVGYNIELLTKYVRANKRITIEEAVQFLTGRLADFLGFTDRGRIRVGKRADIVVFDLAEIEVRPEVKSWDVPDGEGGRTYRYTRSPAPMRLTLVNGVPTFYRGEFTGKFPGKHISPTPLPRG
jgi:N-acyl-D-aspartate/D-glutamate deacylase